MPFELDIPVRHRGWTVKVLDNEGIEDPHIHIRFKQQKWRLKLRDGEFLDGGSWKGIPNELKNLIESRWNDLRSAWDAKHPHNPI